MFINPRSKLFLLVMTLALGGCGGGVPTVNSNPQNSSDNSNTVIVSAPIFPTNSASQTGFVSGPPGVTIIPGPVTPVGPSGTLTIQLETNPTVGFKDINLGINKVQIHLNANASADAAGWQDVAMPRLINENFLNFTDTPLILAKGAVPIGRYKSVKLTFDQSDGITFPNYVSEKNGNQQNRVFPVVVSPASILNTDIEIKKSENSSMGITLNLRALAKTADLDSLFGSYIFHPVATALDLSSVGTIEINLGTTDGTVTVSAQRNGKIIRNKIPASAGIVKLTHLPFSTGDSVGYQVVFSSPNFFTKVINGFPVVSSTKPTQFLALKEALTLEPSLLKVDTPIQLSGPLNVDDSELNAFEVLRKIGDIWFVVDYGYNLGRFIKGQPSTVYTSTLSNSYVQLLFYSSLNSAILFPGGFPLDVIKIRANPDLATIKEQDGLAGQLILINP